MPQSSTLYVGLDVHKESIAVAYIAEDHGAEVIYRGMIGTRHADIEQLVRALQSSAPPLVLVASARTLWVLALARSGEERPGLLGRRALLIPTKAGNRVQTDRRDAVHLARLLRSGDLTPVDVPKVEDEAIRALTHARADALHDLKAAQFRPNAFWLRPDIRDTGRATWGPAHHRGLAEVVRPTPAQLMVVQEDVRAVHEHTERLPRLEQALHAQGTAWRLHPVVEALQALRGVQCTVAVTTVAELGDLTRVDHPRPLMQCLGLIPAEYASGARRRQGSLTTAGNTHARRARGRRLGLP